MLNSDLTTPAAFHKGFGDGLYLAALVEYRPILFGAGYCRSDMMIDADRSMTFFVLVVKCRLYRQMSVIFP